MEPPRPKDGPPIALSLRLEPQYQDEVPVIYFDGNKSVAEEVRILKASLEPFLANMDSMYLIIMGAVIILMQAGFGFLEAGSVRAKNTTNILIKNYADLCFGTVFHMLFLEKRKKSKEFVLSISKLNKIISVENEKSTLTSKKIRQINV